MMALPGRVALVGLGLIGSSLARAIRTFVPEVAVTGWDASADVRGRARMLGLCDPVADTPAEALAGADLVILCVPVLATPAACEAIRPHLAPGTVISDVGSCKASVLDDMRRLLPGFPLVPAHPVAGTEKSGPDAGFATLFKGRWCIVTPDEDAPAAAVAMVSDLWTALGATVEPMDAGHHDMVLAVTSHLPHLIAYTIVGTASDLESVTESEVIKYSAGGFRDFTRIAASDPVMWRDVFLANKEAVLAMLQRFSEDLSALQRAIRWDRGDELEALFTRTREIRRGIVSAGQDDAAADFGRRH